MASQLEDWRTTLASGISAVIAAAIGAYIGGRMAKSAAIKAQQQAAKDQRKRDAEADRRAINWNAPSNCGGTARFTGTTSGPSNKNARDREVVRKGFLTEPPLFAITWTDPNRFVVFESNAGVLGKISNQTLIEHIVSAYSRAKALVDQVNAISQNFERWRTLQDADPVKAMVRAMHDDLEARLSERTSYDRSEVDNLLTEIEEYLRHS